jgi:hypothetical protein
VGALLAAALLGSGQFTSAQTMTTARLQRTPHSLPSTVFLGVWQPGLPENISALQSFEMDAGRRVAIVMFWRDWGSAKNRLDTTWLQNFSAHGSIPLIVWSPADWDLGTDQSPYSLRNIVLGGRDAYIRQWAQKLAQYGKPVLLEWGTQMNGDWYVWGNQPAAYVAAWRHIHDLFVMEGASNVKWVWAPYVFGPHFRARDARPYYPGNSYVDWIGLVGFNSPSNGWLSPPQMFRYSYQILTAFSSKRVIIAMTASGEATAQQRRKGHNKPNWIRNLFETMIPSMPRIRAVVWYNEDRSDVESCRCNDPIESSPAAQRAFARAVAQPWYSSTWK